MWPNLFVKNLFSCIIHKSKYSAKTSNVDTLNPTWNEIYTVPIFTYDDTMTFNLKAHSVSRANVYFMTEMEEKIIIKTLISKSWTIAKSEISIRLNEEVIKYMKSYLSAAGLSS